MMTWLEGDTKCVKEKTVCTVRRLRIRTAVTICIGQAFRGAVRKGQTVYDTSTLQNNNAHITEQKYLKNGKKPA